MEDISAAAFVASGGWSELVHTYSYLYSIVQTGELQHNCYAYYITYTYNGLLDPNLKQYYRPLPMAIASCLHLCTQYIYCTTYVAASNKTSISSSCAPAGPCMQSCDATTLSLSPCSQSHPFFSVYTSIRLTYVCVGEAGTQLWPSFFTDH